MDHQKNDDDDDNNLLFLRPPSQLKTHPNFKSTLPWVTSVKDIYRADEWDPLVYQRMFKKGTPPEERKTIWNNDDEELQNFIIDPEKIDRIYYIDDGVGVVERDAISERIKYDTRTIIARVDRGDDSLPPFYVELWCSFCYHDKFECKKHPPEDCEIFVSTDAVFFIKHLSHIDFFEKRELYKNLKEDGICIDIEEKELKIVSRKARSHFFVNNNNNNDEKNCNAEIVYDDDYFDNWVEPPLRVKTHPNFKSLIPRIEDMLNIYRYYSDWNNEDDDVFNPFIYQGKLKKVALPEEKKTIWKNDDEELQSFIIDPEKIDRIYYMAYKRGRDKYGEYDECDRMYETHEMIARIDRSSSDGDDSLPPLYFNLECCICDHDGFECKSDHPPRKGGYIFVSTNVKLFMKNCLWKVPSRTEVYKCLKEDDDGTSSVSILDLWPKPPHIPF